jgi:hypothetical protein
LNKQGVPGYVSLARVLVGSLCLAFGYAIGCFIGLVFSGILCLRLSNRGFYGMFVEATLGASLCAATDLLIALDARRRIARAHATWCAAHTAQRRGFFAVGLL